MGWLCAKLSLNLMRSIKNCIRGSRAKYLKEVVDNKHNEVTNDIVYAYVLSIEK